MFPRELSSLAMLRWHDGYNAAGGGFTGFLVGAVAAGLLVLSFRRSDSRVPELAGAARSYRRLARQNELRLR